MREEDGERDRGMEKCENGGNGTWESMKEEK